MWSVPTSPADTHTHTHVLVNRDGTGGGDGGGGGGYINIKTVVVVVQTTVMTSVVYGEVGSVVFCACIRVGDIYKYSADNVGVIVNSYRYSHS